MRASSIAAWRKAFCTRRLNSKSSIVGDIDLVMRRDAGELSNT
jgi:hypothetical protein